VLAIQPEAQRTMADQVQRIEDVRGSGIYPATGPLPPGDAVVRSPAELGHPEKRARFQMPSQSLEPAFFAGRAILGGFFLYNGINHFLHHQDLTAYAKSKGVPAAGAAVSVSGALLVAGGLSIVTGVMPKLGAALISTFLMGVSPSMHGFWQDDDPEQRMNDMINFMKNMALVGASMLVAAHPEPWPWSVGQSRGELMPRSR